MRLVWVLLCVLLTDPVVAMPRIAIIIDDLGDRMTEGQRAVALPGPLAMAFLPHTPNAHALAAAAREANKEVMLHLPLQAVSGNDLGPGAITLDTTESEFRRLFRENLDSIPGAVGVNGHMGSLLTRHPGHMTWLMAAMREVGGLFFVDSYTTLESVALQMAGEAGVPAVKRDVFLDTDPDPAAIRFQFERLIRLAKARGSAVGIGHPYPTTLEVLEELLPRVEAYGVELVPVRALLEE